MQKLLKEYLEELNKRQRKKKKIGIAILLLAILVIGGVANILTQYGVAMTGKPKCGLEEHTHDETCYAETLICGLEEGEGHVHTEECSFPKELTCGLEESEGHIHTEECQAPKELICGLEENEEHTHTDECYSVPEGFICGLEESEGHIHTDGCYSVPEGFACGLEEGKGHTHTEDCYTKELICELEEHVHTDICFIDDAADVEDPSVWNALYENVQWKESWAENLVMAAQMQLGYRESTENYQVAENGVHKGYTRYGHFAGSVYADWDAAFVNFCMYYAGMKSIDPAVFTDEIDSAKWCEEFKKIREENAAYLTGPEGYVPVFGDVVFFQRENEETPCQMGIVSAVDEDKNEFFVIEGNSQNEVKENTYPIGDEHIFCYLKISELEAGYSKPEDKDTEIAEEIIELTTQEDGTTITLSGPASSFEAGKEYSIQATKVEDKALIETIEEAIANIDGMATASEKEAETDGTAAESDNASAAADEPAESDKVFTTSDEPVEPEKQPDAASNEPAEPEKQPDVASDEPAGADEGPAAESNDSNADKAPAATPESPAAKSEESEEQVKEVKNYQAFDIKLMADGEEVQPIGPVSVKFSGQEVVNSVEDEETEVKVIHVDESTGEATDMEAVATEESDVVIETNHFSVYVYIEFGDMDLGGVNINIQHWGEGIQTVDGNFVSMNANTPEQGFDVNTGTVKLEEGMYKLYATDENYSLPNETYVDIKSLSKVYNVSDSGYSISKIWVSKDGITEKYDEDEAAWTRGSYTEYSNLDSSDITELKNLPDGSVIRFWYKPKQGTRRDAVSFYDYTIGEGGPISGSSGYSRKGINKDQNFSQGADDQKPRLGIGQHSYGNLSSWVSDTYNGKNLNAGNRVDKCDYAFEGLVKSNLENGMLSFVDGIDAPGNLFQDDPDNGSRLFNGYELGFSKAGDTYILENVYEKNKTTPVSTAKNLTTFKKMNKWVPNGTPAGANGYVFSNRFWPLDSVAHQVDPKGKGDFDEVHNWYFGMAFTVDFDITGYEGPLEYYFRGDDDFWLFVDGKLAVDLGGIHAAMGKAFDLKAFMQQENLLTSGKHTLTVYYMERGATGSCCYMQFTLPRVQISSLPEQQTTSCKVIKKWEDNENGYRPEDVKITLYKQKGQNEGVAVRTIVLPLRDGQGNLIYGKDGKEIWEYTWNNLPKYDGKNNQQIKYFVKEEKLDPVNEQNPMLGYNVKIETNDDGTLAEITNTLTDKKVKVHKVWQDDEKELANRPDKVTFVLYANGKEYRDHNGQRRTVELSAANNWTGEFNHVPEYYYNTSPASEESSDSEETGESTSPDDSDMSKSPNNADKYDNSTAWDDTNVSGDLGAPETSEDDDAETSGDYDSPEGAETSGDYDSPEDTGESAGSDAPGNPAVYDDSNGLDAYMGLRQNTGRWEKVVYTVKEEPALNEKEFAGKNGAIYEISINDQITDAEKEAGYIASFVAENTLVTKNISFEKTSKSNPSNLLQGAEFTLYKIEGEGQADTEIGKYVTDQKGRIDIQGLRFGEYYLKETKAPEAYILLLDPVKISVTKDGVTADFQMEDWESKDYVNLEENSKYVIKVPNELYYVLPSTGGVGIYWYVFGGLFLMVTALIIYKKQDRGVLIK